MDKYYAITEYAQIQKSCALFNSINNSNTSDNVICYIDATYYVKLLQDFETFYYVSYNNINGYIEKQYVKQVLSTPNSPFPNINIKTGNNKCYLRNKPTSSSIALLTISSNTTMQYIGKIYGDEIMDYCGSIWYLVSYNGVIGYIYNGYLSNQPIISSNIEKVTYFEEINYLDLNPLSNFNCVVIIILLIIPMLPIFYYIFKSPSKIMKKPKVISKNNKIDEDTLL